MIKLIDPSWKFDEPVAAIIDIARHRFDKRAFVKRAACFDSDLGSLDVPKNHTVLHVNALGDYESYGVNLNGDAFTAEGGVFKLAEPTSGGPTEVSIDVGNRQTHPTFVKHARVYKHHQNKDPAKSFGPVLKSAYNDRMKRVELLIAVDNDAFADDLQKLASGDPLAWSMSCHVPFDICNVCGNKAASRREYCIHASDHLTDIMKSGHQIGVLNDHMKYFDISRVIRPAERTALTLRKAASAVVIQGGAELAELAGVRIPDRLLYSDEPRMASILKLARKLAEIEKEIPAEIRDDEASAIRRVEPDSCDMDVMRGLPAQDVLDTLGDEKIVLPIKTFLSLVLGSEQQEDVDEVLASIPGMFGRIEDEDRFGEAFPGCGCPHNSLPSMGLQGIMPRMIENHSMSDRPLSGRVVIIRMSSEPRKSIKMANIRPSISSNRARSLVDSYAAYQIDVLSRHADDDQMARMVVYGNHLV